MKVSKMGEEIERWYITSDNSDLYVFIDVVHANGEVVGVVIRSGGEEFELSRFEIEALRRVLENYKI